MTGEKLTIDGVTFVCIHGDKWLSEDGAIEVRRRSGSETFRAAIDLEVLRRPDDKWRRFRSIETAMKAAVKAAQPRRTS